jgi:hypothetical protein
MQTELKDLIIKKVQENINEFQLENFIVDSFREYIYDKKGDYLIGGANVAVFIKNFITIYENK